MITSLAAENHSQFVRVKTSTPGGPQRRPAPGAAWTRAARPAYQHGSAGGSPSRARPHLAAGHYVPDRTARCL